MSLEHESPAMTHRKNHKEKCANILLAIGACSSVSSNLISLAKTKNPKEKTPIENDIIHFESFTRRYDSSIRLESP